MPDSVPASSGGDICGLVWWGKREKTGEPWADGSPHPVGQGGHHAGDGSTCLHVVESATRFSPVEVWEARNPWLLEKVELAPDSGGPGTHRGGLGVDMNFRNEFPNARRFLSDRSDRAYQDRAVRPCRRRGANERRRASPRRRKPNCGCRASSIPGPRPSENRAGSPSRVRSLCRGAHVSARVRLGRGRTFPGPWSTTTSKRFW